MGEGLIGRVRAVSFTQGTSGPSLEMIKTEMEEGVSTTTVRGKRKHQLEEPIGVGE